MGCYLVREGSDFTREWKSFRAHAESSVCVRVINANKQSCCVFAGNWVAYAKYNAYAAYDMCRPCVCELVRVCVATLTWLSLSTIHLVHQFHKFRFDMINVRYDYTAHAPYTPQKKKKRNSLLMAFFFLSVFVFVYLCAMLINIKKKWKYISIVDCRWRAGGGDSYTTSPSSSWQQENPSKSVKKFGSRFQIRC